MRKNVATVASLHAEFKQLDEEIEQFSGQTRDLCEKIEEKTREIGLAITQKNSFHDRYIMSIRGNGQSSSTQYYGLFRTFKKKQKELEDELDALVAERANMTKTVSDKINDREQCQNRLYQLRRYDISYLERQFALYIAHYGIVWW